MEFEFALQRFSLQSFLHVCVSSSRWQYFEKELIRNLMSFLIRKLYYAVPTVESPCRRILSLFFYSPKSPSTGYGFLPARRFAPRLRHGATFPLVNQYFRNENNEPAPKTDEEERDGRLQVVYLNVHVLFGEVNRRARTNPPKQKAQVS